MSTHPGEEDGLIHLRRARASSGIAQGALAEPDRRTGKQAERRPTGERAEGQRTGGSYGRAEKRNPHHHSPRRKTSQAAPHGSPHLGEGERISSPVELKVRIESPKWGAKDPSEPDTDQPRGNHMSDLDELCCPFRAEVISAISRPLVMLIHGMGMLALLFLEF